MRFRLIFLAALSAAASTPAIAMDWSGWYAGIYAGGTQRNESDVQGALAAVVDTEMGSIESPTSISNAGVHPVIFDMLTDMIAPYTDEALALGYVLDGQIGFSTGASLGAVAGYSFGNGFRVEADWSATRFANAQLSLTSGTAQLIAGSYDDDVWTWELGDQMEMGEDDFETFAGGGSAVFLLANAWYDFDNETIFTPYLGGGLGAARVSYMSLGGFGDAVGSGWVPAGQLGGGVIVDLNDRSFLDLGYRFKAAATSAAEVSRTESYGGGEFMAARVTEGGVFFAHTLQAGLSLRF